MKIRHTKDDALIMVRWKGPMSEKANLISVRLFSIQLLHGTEKLKHIHALTTTDR